MRQRHRGLVRNRDNWVRQSFPHKIGTLGPFDAMRRKCLELRIILRVVTTMGNKKDMALAGGIRKPSDVRKQSLGAGHVELSAGQHEISLRVNFPEDQIA